MHFHQKDWYVECFCLYSSTHFLSPPVPMHGGLYFHHCLSVHADYLHTCTTVTLLEKFISANWYCIITVTGRAHCQRQVAFLSPPVHVARWAHMHHFLSVVCLSVCPSVVWTGPKREKIIHISGSIGDRKMKLCHNVLRL